VTRRNSLSLDMGSSALQYIGKSMGV